LGKWIKNRIDNWVPTIPKPRKIHADSSSFISSNVGIYLTADSSQNRRMEESELVYLSIE